MDGAGAFTQTKAHACFIWLKPQVALLAIQEDRAQMPFGLGSQCRGDTGGGWGGGQWDFVKWNAVWPRLSPLACRTCLVKGTVNRQDPVPCWWRPAARGWTEATRLWERWPGWVRGKAHGVLLIPLRLESQYG